LALVASAKKAERREGAEFEMSKAYLNVSAHGAFYSPNPEEFVQPAFTNKIMNKILVATERKIYSQSATATKNLD
jgi:hypothetical protein